MSVGSSVTVFTGAKPADVSPSGFCDTHTPTPPTPPVPVTPEPDPPTTPDPETPTTPAPETPDPEAPACTYKHRIIGVPATTGGGYTSQILIGSEDATATVTLRAYQHDNGHAIDVLDSEGAAVGASTSLAPANSIKRFQLEAATGWHTVIVEHPTKAAMDAATVAMRLREPDTGVTVIPVPGIEHCTTASTVTTEDPPAAGTE